MANKTGNSKIITKLAIPRKRNRQIIFQPHPHRPQTAEKVFFFLSGAIISTPFPLLYNTLGSNILLLSLPFSTALLLSVAVLAPILEEYAKAYPLFYRHGETERSLVTLGFLTGLGFGIAELFLYVFIMNAPVSIRIPLVLFHAATATITAFGIGRYRPFAFLAFAIFLHALYNYSLLMQQGLGWISLSIIIFTLLLALFLYSRTIEKEIK